MKRHSTILIALIVLSAFSAGALGTENLLPCGSRFLAGPDGWISCGLAEPPQTGTLGARTMLLQNSGSIRGETVWRVLETGLTYTVSFDLVAKGAARVRAEVITTDWRWLATREWSATTTCRRVSMGFSVNRPTSGFYLRLTHVNGNMVGYDAFVLAEGKRAESTPAEDRFFSARIETPGDIWLREEGLPRMTCRFGGADWTNTLPVLLSVSLSGQVVIRQTVSRFSDRVDVTCPFARECGYYPCELVVSGRGGKVVERRSVPFVVTSRSPMNPFFGIQTADGVSVAALSRLGAGMRRRNSQFWRWAEPNGPVAWKDDLRPKSVDRPPLRTLGTLLGHEVPPWACRRGGRTMADFHSMTSFVRHAVRVERDCVDQLEIINEPDLTLQALGLSAAESVDYYCGIVNAVSPLIRQGDIPVGVDVSGVGLPFLEDVLSRISSRLDFVALHPYAWPRELAEQGRRDCGTPETGGFLAGLARGLRLLKAYPNLKVGIGELGWSLAHASRPDDASSYRQAAFLARTYLLARSFPRIDYLVWFSLANMPEHGRYDYGLWRSDRGLRPLPSVAAYAECARQLQAAEDVRHEDLGADVHLISWRARGESRFAFWCDELGAQTGTIRLTNSVACVDLFGHPVAPQGLLLSELPVYVAAKEADAKSILKTLRQSLSDKARVRDLGGTETVSLSRERPFVRLLDRRQDVMPPDPSVNWQGPGDLSARLSLVWEGEGLRLCVTVRDDEHVQLFKDGFLWKNDCLQIGVDPLGDARRGFGYLPDDWEVGVSDGQPVWAWQAGDGKVGERNDVVSTVERSGCVTRYDVFLPWKMLCVAPRVGLRFGLALAIRDTDAKGVPCYLAFGHGLVSGKEPSRFVRIVLSNETKGKNDHETN